MVCKMGSTKRIGLVLFNIKPPLFYYFLHLSIGHRGPQMCLSLWNGFCASQFVSLLVRNEPVQHLCTIYVIELLLSPVPLLLRQTLLLPNHTLPERMWCLHSVNIMNTSVFAGLLLWLPIRLLVWQLIGHAGGAIYPTGFIHHFDP